MKGSILSLIAIIITGFYLLANSVSLTEDSRTNSQILNELDELIKVRPTLIDEKIRQADSLADLVNSTQQPREKIRLSFDAADLYSRVDIDSAIATINRGYELAMEIKDTVSAERFMILRAKEYFFRGLIHEAFLDIDFVKNDGIHPHNWLIYHNTCSVIYITLSELNEYQPFEVDLAETAVYHASLEMGLLSKNDPSYYIAEAIAGIGKNDLPKMAESLETALSLMDENHELFYTAHALLGEYYTRMGQTDKAIRHNGIASIIQTRDSRLYEVSILRLGELLAKDGDFTRAYSYLSTALDNTLRSDAKFNMMRVTNAYTECIHHIGKDRQNRFVGLVIAVIILIILLLVIIKLTIDKRKEVDTLRHTELLLAKSNLAKDTYIGEFMNLCSSYIESLEEYNNMCKRKISTGQIDSLLAYIKSGSVLDEQRKKFYDVFDRAFLILFPDFIKKVNTLLLPDKRYAEDGKFNTELHILALTRLGIEDSNTIARFLGISANTIYTYRNKMRSRAADRSTFDEDLKQIDAV